VLLIEGVGLLLLLQLAVAGISARGVPSVWSVSAWVVALFAAYLLVMYLVYRYRGRPRWTPSPADDVPHEADAREPDDSDADARSRAKVFASFGALSLLVLAGGWLAAHSADVIARQTGLGSAFVGATLLAAATSLPEVSTTVAAVRNERYTTAVSNVFGSNAFDVSLLFLADVLYREDTIFAHAELTVVFVATIASAMNCIYLWGLPLLHAVGKCSA
jgi:cation:H+ antiporter